MKQPQRPKLNPQSDLAGVKYWDGHYRSDLELEHRRPFSPTTYDQHVLATHLREAVPEEAGRILEVGCGGSVWLPYLGRYTGAEACGVDYSELGCRIARRRLADVGVGGQIICADIRSLSPADTGAFDFVFSLGVVEHFEDYAGLVAHLSQFLNPGGVMFTEVPNLRSIHGMLARLWHPSVYERHKTIDLNSLLRAHEDAGLIDIRGFFGGVFSLRLVGWQNEPRSAAFARLLMPFIRLVSGGLDRMLLRMGKTEGSAWSAPFLMVRGRRPS